MTDYEWILPILKTWAHIGVGVSVISILIVVGLVFGKWVGSILEQIQKKE